MTPTNKRRKNIPKSQQGVTCNLVYAYAEGVEWIIYTDLQVTSPEEMKAVLKYYAARWHIENFHKVLKTAYKIEDI
jgi:IS4 transposase